MNLFARILSHGFALVVVALLAIGLIYRGELFPEYGLPDFLSLGHKPATHATEQQAETGTAVPAEPAQPAAGDIAAGVPEVPEAEFKPSATIDRSMPAPEATEPAAAEPAEAVDAAGQAMTERGDGTVDAETAAVPQATHEAVPPQPAAETQDVPPPPVLEEAGVAAPETDIGTAATTGAPEPEIATSAPATLPADTDVGAESAAAAASQGRPSPAVTPYRVLAAAREAYWLRDYAAAEQKYQELIAMDPDNPDGYGELGNMYFSQGEWEKASASYYEAGTRLAAQGMYDRARQLVEVIRGLNGGQAGDLEQQISAAETAAP